MDISVFSIYSCWKYCASDARPPLSLPVIIRGETGSGRSSPWPHPPHLWSADDTQWPPCTSHQESGRWQGLLRVHVSLPSSLSHHVYYVALSPGHPPYTKTMIITFEPTWNTQGQRSHLLNTHAEGEPGGKATCTRLQCIHTTQFYMIYSHTHLPT